MDSARTERRKPRKLMKVDEGLSLSEYVRNNKKYWNDVFNQLDTYHGSVENESKMLAEVLPKDLYEKVCASLNIPRTEVEESKPEGITVNLPRRIVKEPQISTRKCLYVNRELDSDTEVEFCASDEEEKSNIYLDMLNKPIREQITWPTRYLQPEREDEKSLVKKADDLTDRVNTVLGFSILETTAHIIANEFCEYMKQLGGDQQSKLFTPKAIKELFQLSRYASLNREITKDIKAEQRTPNVTAFSQSLPMSSQYHPPRNETKKLWRSAKHVPRELVTLKTVWEGITNLRSVKEYCRWMIHHPEHRRPPYLKSLGLFDPVVLDARLTFESEYQITPPISSPHDPPAPIENMRTGFSESINHE
ncbi:unnamed protein product [Spodoptera exigua]|nr:unnamed protein product [Spodoptera exigua]